jgi:hypothetical protein
MKSNPVVSITKLAFLSFVVGCTPLETRSLSHNSTANLFHQVLQDCHDIGCDTAPVVSTGACYYWLPPSTERLRKSQRVVPFLEKVSKSGTLEQKQLAAVCLQLAKSRKVTAQPQRDASGQDIICYMIPAPEQ